MNDVVGLLIAGIAVVGGVLGIARPEIFRSSSLEGQFTPQRARIGGIVILLPGLAGLWAILHGGRGEFFPA